MYKRKQIILCALVASSAVSILSYGIFYSFKNRGNPAQENASIVSAATEAQQFSAAADGIVSDNLQTLHTDERPEERATTVSRGEEERTLPRKTPSGELILEIGVNDEQVKRLQQNLQKIGYFNTEPTGYFGEITAAAVIQFQKQYSLQADGQAGPETVSKVEEVAKNPPPAPAPVSAPAISSQPAPAAKAQVGGSISLLPWFGSVESIFSIGATATVTDVDTGLSFRVIRSYGYNHADSETLTAQDTEILRRIAGGSWNWTRRAVIVEVNGYRIAASLTAMPHAGRDDKPANANVDNRSGGYGYGTNLDTVKGNNMDGHFDIHFSGSRTHSTNQVDSDHQQMVQKAYNSGL